MKLNSRLVMLVTCASLLLGAVALPLLAQETSVTTNESALVVTGAVDFTDSGDIMVAGYIIAPAGAFQPSMLVEGDIVIITGTLLPDGITIQAEAFEFFDDSGEATPEATVEATPELTPEATVESTPELTPEATVEATPELTPEATEEPITCGNPNHPVATAIAEEFDVSVEVVIGMHCSGFGFGAITRAFLLAEATGGDAQSYLDLKASGTGWGQIMREAGVHPSDLAPGHVIGKNKHHGEATAEPEMETSSQGNGRGQGNGNGRGNGNQGGNGNGNGQGNGGGKKN
jgi:hypothetical protein